MNPVPRYSPPPDEQGQDYQHPDYPTTAADAGAYSDDPYRDFAPSGATEGYQENADGGPHNASVVNSDDSPSNVEESHSEAPAGPSQVVRNDTGPRHPPVQNFVPWEQLSTAEKFSLVLGDIDNVFARHLREVYGEPPLTKGVGQPPPMHNHTTILSNSGVPQFASSRLTTEWGDDSNYRRQVTRPPVVDPLKDETIRTVITNAEGSVQRLMGAMKNMDGVHDSENSHDVKLLVSAKISERDRRAACRDIMTALIYRCVIGYTMHTEKDDAKKADMDLNCASRLDHVINALKLAKTACRDILYYDYKIAMLVHAPRTFEKTKFNHKKTNETKKMTYTTNKTKATAYDTVISNADNGELPVASSPAPDAVASPVPSTARSTNLSATPDKPKRSRKRKQDNSGDTEPPQPKKARQLKNPGGVTSSRNALQKQPDPPLMVPTATQSPVYSGTMLQANSLGADYMQKPAHEPADTPQQHQSDMGRDSRVVDNTDIDWFTHDPEQYRSSREGITGYQQQEDPFVGEMFEQNSASPALHGGNIGIHLPNHNFLQSGLTGDGPTITNEATPPPGSQQQADPSIGQMTAIDSSVVVNYGIKRELQDADDDSFRPNLDQSGAEIDNGERAPDHDSIEQNFNELGALLDQITPDDAARILEEFEQRFGHNS